LCITATNYIIGTSEGWWVIPPTSVLWKRRRRDDAAPWEPRNIHKIVSYNELSRVVGNEMIGDDDVMIVENLEKNKKVVDDKKVVDE